MLSRVCTRALKALIDCVVINDQMTAPLSQNVRRGLGRRRPHYQWHEGGHRLLDALNDRWPCPVAAPAIFMPMRLDPVAQMFALNGSVKRPQPSRRSGDRQAVLTRLKFRHVAAASAVQTRR